MRLCSTEGVLQLATCNRTPEVGWRNSGGICQWMYEKEGLHLGSPPPEKGLHAQLCEWESHIPRSASMTKGYGMEADSGVTPKEEHITLWHHLNFVTPLLR